MAAKRASGGKGEGGGGKGKELFGLELSGWLRAATAKGASVQGAAGRAVFVGLGAKAEKALAALDVPAWARDRALKRRGELVFAGSDDGPLWLMVAAVKGQPGSSHEGLLDPSPYAIARDLCGALAAQLPDHNVGELTIEFEDASDEEKLGAMVGLELGSYRFKTVRQRKSDVPRAPRLKLEGVPDALVQYAATLGTAVNVGRHLVNLPPCDLDPETYAAAIQALFKGSSTTTVEVWKGDRLVKERMGLLRAVGQGASAGPALVHLRYRAHGKTKHKQPLAFVGKGITFDSGGLDIKDAASMRLMKKDMGGAASLTGLAWWVEQSGIDVDCDFYLALAENAVDRDSFHPGDILTSRNGQTVEIDNTDAEGRLVLADALDVATNQKGKDAPAALIDLATLTGAMRIALGTRLAGMFATDDQIAVALLGSAQRRGDPAWRMPLWPEYMPQLKSTVADVANSGPSRFGGAITAALFMQRFVGPVPWAHFDMYGWTEAGVGGCAETGGNGQCVQLLAEFLASWGD